MFFSTFRSLYAFEFVPKPQMWLNVTVLCFSALSVVRSGDYYLFETDSEEEEEEEEKKEDDPQKKSAFQVTAGFQMSLCL